MSTNTPDQQITYPADGDAADNPLAFNQFVADVEPRLVREYTTEADRTARMLALAANEISSLSAPSVGLPRVEVYNGSAHVSLYRRSVYAIAYKTADQNVGPSNTALQNLTDLVIPLPGTASAVFQFTGVIWYNSNTTADIKFAFTFPAGATMRWGVIGLATGAASTSGDATFANAAASGTAINVGGGAGDALLRIEGEITMGATAGNLQLQAAQVTSDASATSVFARSRLTAWRFA